jgi:hypothetical protein
MMVDVDKWLLAVDKVVVVAYFASSGIIYDGYLLPDSMKHTFYNDMQIVFVCLCTFDQISIISVYFFINDYVLFRHPSII